MAEVPYSRSSGTVKRGAELTEKEALAVELLCEGRDGTQIAAVLNIDHSTVCRRLKRARIKLGAETYPELAVKFDRLRRG